MFKSVRRFLGKAYRAAKIFTNPGKSVARLLTETVRDVGSKYPPQVKNILLQYGNQRVIDIKMCKEIVSENTEFLLKALSGAKTWDEAKKKYGFDRFYHLFMIATLENGQQLHIEKNEVIRISTSPRPCTDSLDLGMPREPITLNDLMERTKQRIGDRDFFTYDPLANNCQNFVNQLLRTMGLWNETASKFVFQDIKGLREELPSYTKYIAKGLTDLWAIANTAYQKTKDYIDNGEQSQE